MSVQFMMERGYCKIWQIRSIEKAHFYNLNFELIKTRRGICLVLPYMLRDYAWIATSYNDPSIPSPNASNATRRLLLYRVCLTGSGIWPSRAFFCAPWLRVLCVEHTVYFVGWSLCWIGRHRYERLFQKPDTPALLTSQMSLLRAQVRQEIGV